MHMQEAIKKHEAFFKELERQDRIRQTLKKWDVSKSGGLNSSTWYSTSVDVGAGYDYVRFYFVTGSSFTSDFAVSWSWWWWWWWR